MISLYYDHISLLFNFLRFFRVMYQESSIGSENLAHLQSIENKCKILQLSAVIVQINYKNKILKYYRLHDLFNHTLREVGAVLIIFVKS